MQPSKVLFSRQTLIALSCVALGACGGGGGAPADGGDAAGDSSPSGDGSGDGVDGATPGELANIATPIDPTVPSSFATANAFLYTGPNAVQTGVVAGAIDPTRLTILRGRVLGRDGAALAGVAVSAPGHPELGVTATRTDGHFDFAANGGAPVRLALVKDGYLSAERQLATTWQGFVHVKDVVLIGLDTAVTVLSSGMATPQVARGGQVTDDDGVRRATVIVPAGTSAGMLMPGGVSLPLTTMHVRATEYTVGPTGPAAMPASLPPESAYTYAVDLSVDEARAAGATSVSFSQPLPFYVENFLHFPAGTVVPTGYYDPARGAWISSKSGVVLTVVSLTAGRADLDVTGTGFVSSPAALTALGITDEERTQLATLYTAGQSLWRVPVQHFTAWDCNWPYGPPPDAKPPSRKPPKAPPKPPKPCIKRGSVVACQSQILGDAIPLTGTPYALRYSSDRSTGATWQDQVVIPLSDETVPASLKRIDLEIDIGGRHFEMTFPPKPNQSYTFTWDRRDAYGRILQGAQRATLVVSNVYEAVYGSAASFGELKDGVLTADRARQEISYSIRRTVLLGALSPSVLGGWTLDVHHAWDATTGTLFEGDGSTRAGLDSVGANVITTVTGQRGQQCADGDPCGDGGPAKKGLLVYPTALAAAPDGSLYVYDNYLHRIRRIDRQGVITTVAGVGNACLIALRSGKADGAVCGNGGPAKAAGLGDVLALAVGPDGSLYLSETGWVRRIGTDGVISVVAGANRGGAPEDGPGLATEVNVNVSGIAVGDDGSLYLAELRRIRRVGPDGMITTLAGGGVTDCFGDCGDGGPAKRSQVKPTKIVRAADGTLYFDDKGATIRRITPDGIISTIAGSAAIHRAEGDGGPPSAATFLGIYGLAIDGEGGLLIADADRVRRIGVDDVISTIAGPGASSVDGEGGPAKRAWLGQNALQGFAYGADGRLYVADTLGGIVRQIGPALPGGTLQDLFVPSEDGAQLYAFRDGRHLWTRDALTSATLRDFAYDPQGRLTQVTDRSGNATVIHRAASGTPTSIEGPYGDVTTLALNADGNLEAVTGPGKEAWALAYGTGGLLTTLTDPAGGVHRFTYDAQGRLIKDESPGGGSTTLARTESETGFRVDVTTAGGQMSSYTIENLPTGELRRTGIQPGGARTEALVRADGTTRVTYADGTVAELVEGPDPRFGMLAPIIEKLVTTTPGGSSSTQTGTRTAVLADALTLTSQTDTVTLGGRAYTRTYDAATRTETLSSPAGRQLSITFDAKGRIASRHSDVTPAQTPVVYTYDAHGALAQLTQGKQSATFARDAHGRVSSRTDALGHATVYVYDDAGRTIQTATPIGNGYGLAYDGNSNLTGLTMPGTGAYAFAYSPASRMTSYKPPENPAYVTTYDLDRRLTQVVLPGGRTEKLGLDGAGRPNALTTPESTVAVSYLASDATSRQAGTSWTAATGGATQSLAFTYDGDQATAASWSGAAAGKFTYAYDASFLLSQVALTSGADAVSTPLTRDQDGLLTGLGAFMIERKGPGGQATRISDGTLSLSVTHDALARFVGTTHTIGAKAAYDAQVTFDDAGRVVREAVTIGAAAASVTDYVYDADSQLTQVTRDGAVVERYSYDANGNRVSRQLGADAAEAATYDKQDRLTQQGAVAIRFDADGFLAQRGSDLFRYGTGGELLQATVGASTVTYAYDALRRRTSRSDGASTTQYLYGNPDDDLQVTQSRGPTGVLTTYYYGDGGRLFALRRGADVFYVATDRLGSPRLVSDAAGAAVKAVSYDGFGQVRADSNPTWDLPIGFAGGLNDPTTRLVRFGFRDYDPAAGRWTARDPDVLGGRQANLYVYVGNDPVNLIDPTGLVGLGGTVCDGVCVGTKINITADGLSACVEGGFGIGSSLEIDPLGALDDNGLTFEGKIAGKLGIVKAEVSVTGLELGECAYTNAKPKVEVCGGPVCAKPYDPTTPKGKVSLEETKPETGSPQVKGKDPFKGSGFGVTGKYVAKVCQKVGW